MLFFYFFFFMFRIFNLREKSKYGGKHPVKSPELALCGPLDLKQHVMLPCKKDTISHTATQSHVRSDRFPQKRQDLTSKYSCYYRISRETICNTTPSTKQAGDFSGFSTLPVWSPATKQACDQTGAKTPACSIAGDQTGRRLFRRQQRPQYLT